LEAVVVLPDRIERTVEAYDGNTDGWAKELAGYLDAA
jgi:hypothetical protein